MVMKIMVVIKKVMVNYCVGLYLLWGERAIVLTHTQTHTRRPAHTRTHAHARARTRTHAHTHAHARTRTHMHTHARPHTRTCTHTHAHAYTRTPTHTRAHARTRTHARTCTRPSAEPLTWQKLGLPASRPSAQQRQGRNSLHFSLVMLKRLPTFQITLI